MTAVYTKKIPVNYKIKPTLEMSDKFPLVSTPSQQLRFRWYNLGKIVEYGSRYLKDFDYYQKCAQERAQEDKPLLKRSRHNSGCLCFTSNKSRRGGVNERPLLAGNTV
uniref:Uncharacterized protein n=1 Tax=Timema bartmani TaxID=61472 RepID=A0A7R9FDB1_9NEOP|nr:unnamed protein product [Timema bartmani]